MNLFIMSIFEQGFIFSIMVMGVFITYDILDFPDLTVDGTFPLGAAITASLLTKGVNPYIACIISTFIGSLAGGITGFLNVKCKITNLISGILVAMGLYSINLRIMGRANIPLFNMKTVFSMNNNTIVIAMIFVLIIKLSLDYFFNTKYGFILKAVGDNEKMVTSLGINTGNMKIVGIMISNGLVALSGALMAQYQGFSDVSMGTGVMIMGLASVIFGKSVFKEIFKHSTTVVILGSILYKTAVGIALKIGLPAYDLKLITSIIIVIALTLNLDKMRNKLRKSIVLGGNKNVTDA